jgi:cation diffusion facilitator CzcD-associated flavoprotein CzcO
VIPTTSPRQTQREIQVLVIGAGPAGIATAYYLQQAGIPYRVIDQADQLASTWASLYPSLRLNTTRFFSHLPGRRFPLAFGIFPTAKQYHRYLCNFVADHRLNIQLGVTVQRVFPEGGGWRVESSAGSAWYPVVISATGRFNRPYWPRIPGMDAFGGTLLHAHDYLGPEPYTGQRVMVVGNGPTGVDIATELARHAAAPVLLAQRTGVVLRPRYPWGLPKHLWMMLAEVLPDRIGHPLLRYMLDLRFEGLDALGLKVPTSEADSSAAGASRGRELINVVRAGLVRSVEAPVQFYPDQVALADGRCVAVDAVILATGYQPVLFNYLDFGGEDVPTNRDGWPLRVHESPDDVTSGRRQVLGQPGLYLVGTFYQGKGAMYNFNTEAAAAVAEIGVYLAEREAAETVE